VFLASCFSAVSSVTGKPSSEEKEEDEEAQEAVVLVAVVRSHPEELPLLDRSNVPSPTPDSTTVCAAMKSRVEVSWAKRRLLEPSSAVPEEVMIIPRSS